jgi:hypothetical protein
MGADEVEGRSAPRMRSSVVTKWVGLDSMSSLGLTSGVKKVRALWLLIVGDVQCRDYEFSLHCGLCCVSSCLPLLLGRTVHENRSTFYIVVNCQAFCAAEIGNHLSAWI